MIDVLDSLENHELEINVVVHNVLNCFAKFSLIRESCLNYIQDFKLT